MLSIMLLWVCASARPPSPPSSQCDPAALCFPACLRLPLCSTAKQRDYDSPNLLLTVRSRGGGGRGGLSELKSLNLNPAMPHQLAVAAADPFVRIYDRRMLTPGGGGGQWQGRAGRAGSVSPEQQQHQGALQERQLQSSGHL